MGPNPKLTVLAAQQKGAPLPRVQTSDEAQPAVEQQMHDSFVARGGGWGVDSDGDHDDD